MADVLIEYDKNEMLQISTGGHCIFHGHEHDFSRSPNALKQFIQSLGHRVYVKEVKDLTEL